MIDAPANFNFHLREGWHKYSQPILLAAIVLIGTLAAFKLAAEFARLLFDPSRVGAIDLKYYSDWTQVWFTGAPFYMRPERPEYPPASMPILWLLAGWLAFDQARLLWAGLDTIVLFLITLTSIRWSGANTWRERVIIALAFLSMGGTVVTIGNGQLILFILPALVAAIWLLYRYPTDTRATLLAALLLLFALAKPSLSVPFFWLALFAPRGIRTIAIVAIAYAALTFFAAAYQPGDLVSQLQLMLANGTQIAAVTLDGNIHFVLGYLGWNALILPASLAALVALGWWTWQNRTADRWTLLSVAALVARLWTYHRVYEDVLLIVPEVALFQVAKNEESPRGTVAAILFAMNLIAFLPPGTLTSVPHQVEIFLVVGRLSICIVDLVFFLWCARTRDGTPSSPIEN